MKKTKTNIWWIRRDIRLHDNSALQAALQESPNVIPLFIFDPKLWNTSNASQTKLAFLAANLKALNDQLESLGSKLIIRYGHPREEMEKFFHQFQVDAIFAEADFTPYARQRDAKIANHFPLKLAGGSTVINPEAVKKIDGTPYQVYTPFMRQWKSIYESAPTLVFDSPSQIATPKEISSPAIKDIPYHPEHTGFPAGEEEALRRLDQ
ncbi:MAG: deoxyribodipyrimidine photo-lyase, partial [Anaerolineales bacterium]